MTRDVGAAERRGERRRAGAAAACRSSSARQRRSSGARPCRGLGRQIARACPPAGSTKKCLHFGPSSDIVLFGGCSGQHCRRCASGRDANSQELAMPLTKRQREILNYLTLVLRAKAATRRASRRSRTNFNYNSLATVHEHLSNLERKGYIKRSYNESRAIEILPSEIVSSARSSCPCSAPWPPAARSRRSHSERDDRGAGSTSCSAAATTTCCACAETR